MRDPRLPAGIGCVTSVASGDRRLFVYASIDDAGNPKSWHLRLIEGDRQEDRALPGGTVASYPRAVAVTDVDDDGSPDWWVKVRDYASHGAPWGGLFLYVERGGTIAPLRYQGAPLVIDFGGITRLGEGAACRDGDLVLLRAEAKDRRNLRWATSERRFAIEGRSARLVDRTQSTLVIEDYNDPDLDPYYEVTCDGVSFSVFAPPPD